MASRSLKKPRATASKLSRFLCLLGEHLGALCVYLGFLYLWSSEDTSLDPCSKKIEELMGTAPARGLKLAHSWHCASPQRTWAVEASGALGSARRCPCCPKDKDNRKTVKLARRPIKSPSISITALSWLWYIRPLALPRTDWMHRGSSKDRLGEGRRLRNIGDASFLCLTNCILQVLEKKSISYWTINLSGIFCEISRFENCITQVTEVKFAEKNRPFPIILAISKRELTFSTPRQNNVNIWSKW